MIRGHWHADHVTTQPTTQPAATRPVPTQPTTTDRRALRDEVLLVLGVSLGASAVYSFLALLARLTAPGRLSEQQATLNASRAPERPWLDLAYQLVDIGFALVPVLLALYMLRPEPLKVIGVDTRRPWFDLSTGAGLAALIGIPGLGLYLAAHALNLNANVVPAALPDVWWAVPILVLSAAQNAVLEEVVVVGYLITRLEQMGLKTAAVVASSSLLRGAYHLYQGFGGFVGNAIMGVIFSVFFLRTRRTMPLIVAHTILDVVAFVGYALLHDRVSWI